MAMWATGNLYSPAFDQSIVSKKSISWARSSSEREVVGSNHGRVWQAELATGMAHFSIKWQGSPDMAIVARKGT